jgi:hypothetical protein
VILFFLLKIYPAGEFIKIIFDRTKFYLRLEIAR